MANICGIYKCSHFVSILEVSLGHFTLSVDYQYNNATISNAPMVWCDYSIFLYFRYKYYGFKIGS